MTASRKTEDLLAKIPEIRFGRLMYREWEGTDCIVESLAEVSSEDTDRYVLQVKNAGYLLFSMRSTEDNRFYAFLMGETVLYLSYYNNIKQMRIIVEEDDSYLKEYGYALNAENGTSDSQKNDDAENKNMSTLLTQIDLVDYGLSYLIRLSDGRFVIFDGGFEFEQDADKLMRQLKIQSSGEKPQIAAWIFTHPHIDHYRCFMVFYKKYRNDVRIEKFLYNFPCLTDDVVQKIPDLGECDEVAYLQRFEEIVEESGRPVIRPHTGQIYRISNARFEILSSPDDTYNFPCSGNDLSLVVKMTAEGQSILFCADANLKTAHLAERYGAYLKSDILQITHHGYNGGCSECYRLVSPKVCLLPGEEGLFYSKMGYFHESNRTLIYDMDVQEILIGDSGNTVLKLPYTPRPNGKELMIAKAKELQKAMGATSWFFPDLTWEECKFSFLNACCVSTVVYADLFFDNTADTIRRIKITLPMYQVTRVDFENGQGLDRDALFCSRASLANKGIPVGKVFSVHFTCEHPTVICGPKPPAYVV